MIPVEPEWLIDALGVGLLDPGLPYQGPPRAVPHDRLELRAIRETPNGPTTKITILDAVTARILEQYVYDAQGRLQASSISEGYRRDPATGLAMPTAVRISVPSAQFSLRIELGNVQVNCLPDHPTDLWTMPRLAGYQAIDLCDPHLRLAPCGGSARGRGAVAISERKVAGLAKPQAIRPRRTAWRVHPFRLPPSAFRLPPSSIPNSLFVHPQRLDEALRLIAGFHVAGIVEEPLGGDRGIETHVVEVHGDDRLRVVRFG